MTPEARQVDTNRNTICILPGRDAEILADGPIWANIYEEGVGGVMWLDRETADLVGRGAGGPLYRIKVTARLPSLEKVSGVWA